MQPMSLSQLWFLRLAGDMSRMETGFSMWIKNLISYISLVYFVGNKHVRIFSCQ